MHKNKGEYVLLKDSSAALVVTMPSLVVDDHVDKAGIGNAKEQGRQSSAVGIGKVFIRVPNTVLKALCKGQGYSS